MYQGHKSRAYWNVALWIGNDEGLYRLALDCIRQGANRRQAAELMLDTLKECGGTCQHPETPDGYAYSVDKIQRAMSGLT